MQATDLQRTADGSTTFGSPAFEDRRKGDGASRPGGPERRQFQDSRNSENSDAVELAEAIDQYKLTHRRRFITYEELHSVIENLGYTKTR
jgi:hypothetical protein